MELYTKTMWTWSKIMNEDEVELLEDEFDEGTQQSIDEFISNINLEEDND